MTKYVKEEKVIFRDREFVKKITLLDTKYGSVQFELLHDNVVLYIDTECYFNDTDNDKRGIEKLSNSIQSFLDAPIPKILIQYNTDAGDYVCKTFGFKKVITNENT